MRRWKRRRSGLAPVLLWAALGNAVLCADQVKGEPAANAEPARRPLLNAVSHLAVRSDYSETAGHAARHDALVLNTQLSLVSSERSFSPGFMVEGRLADDGRQTVIAAGMFSYTTARWTLTASPFYERTFPADRWLYWGNARRELAPRHSLGLELYGSIGTLKPSKWLLAYSASVSRPLTVSVAIGSGVGPGPDLVTRTIVSWQLSASRR